MLTLLAVGCGGEAWQPAQTVTAPQAAVVDAAALLPVDAAPPDAPSPDASLPDAAPLPPLSPAGADALELLDEVFARYAADPTMVPGHDDATQPAQVRVHVFAGDVEFDLKSRRTWSVGSRRFVVVSRADLQVRADALDGEARYLNVGVFLESDGAHPADEARVGVGFDYALPTPSRVMSLCCCARFARFARRAGKWRIVEESGLACG